jgi:hypothetical protein
LTGLHESLGNYDRHALQRWRVLSVEAVFKMNHNIESDFNLLFASSIVELETFLQDILPQTSIPFHFIGFEEHPQLLAIVKSARELSFRIQHGIVSCRLFVTITASGGEGDDVIGAYAYGLERSDEGRSVLLEPKAITGLKLRSYLGR